MPQNPGQSQSVTDAIQRRQQGGSSPALNQVSPGAAMANPLPQPIPQSQMTQASAPVGAPTPEAPRMPKFEPQDRQDLITVALIEQLKNDAKLVKEQGKAAAGETQQPPTPQAPAQPAPMGGGAGSFSLSPGFEQPMATSQMQSNYGSGMGSDYSGMSGYGSGRM